MTGQIIRCSETGVEQVTARNSAGSINQRSRVTPGTMQQRKTRMQVAKRNKERHEGECRIEKGSNEEKKTNEKRNPQNKRASGFCSLVELDLGAYMPPTPIWPHHPIIPRQAQLLQQSQTAWCHSLHSSRLPLEAWKIFGAKITRGRMEDQSETGRYAPSGRFENQSAQPRPQPPEIDLGG